MTHKPVILGVSACLLGRAVRFDGGHKRDPFVVDDLRPHARFVPVCPEVELGLGTPRETLRLVQHDGAIRLIMKTGADHTDGMHAYASRRVRELEEQDLDGFILKKDSPSCGFERVKVYGKGNAPVRSGRGLFASALIDANPDLPVEDEGRLLDAGLRENFIERVFAFRRVKDFFARRWTYGDLVGFHTVHKMVVLAHDAAAYAALGRLVADGRRRPRQALAAEYRTMIMQALAKPATPKRHANVLMHMVGHFRDRLDTASRDEVLTHIDEFRRGLLPLIVPITLVRHHARRLDVAYLTDQIYLDPHPRELALRNHV
jgi:uncharacterized protein YbgA (DUF1722 family)/uncharacterized protein YbbK (DUF523 family)